MLLDFFQDVEYDWTLLRYLAQSRNCVHWAFEYKGQRVRNGTGLSILCLFMLCKCSYIRLLLVRHF
jgi:hypothetical protein